MYMTGYWKELIKPVVVVKETAMMVEFPGGRRTSKRSRFDNYFPTWDDAKRFLLNREKSDLAQYERSAECCRGRIAELESLKPPAEEAVR